MNLDATIEHLTYTAFSPPRLDKGTISHKKTSNSQTTKIQEDQKLKGKVSKTYTPFKTGTEVLKANSTKTQEETSTQGHDENEVVMMNQF